MTLELDISVPVSLTPDDQVAYIRRAEELGFAGVGIGDNLSSGNDVFVTMALAASRTSRILLYPAACNPVTRHPIVLANAIRSLAEHAPGRVKLAVARGGKDLGLNELAPASLGDLREAVSIIRGRLRDWDEDRAPTVALAASGPRTLAVAGEVADEVLLQIGPDPLARERALRYVDAGVTQAGRWPGEVAVTDYVIASIADDRETALRRALPWVQYMIGVGTFRLALEAHAVSQEELSELGRLTGGWEGHLADLLLIAGTADGVAERLDRMRLGGARHVCCMVPGGPKTHRETLEALGRHVLPALG